MRILKTLFIIVFLCIISFYSSFGDDSARDTLINHYDKINRGDYRGAYDDFSQNWKKWQSYEKFISGFPNLNYIYKLDIVSSKNVRRDKVQFKTILLAYTSSRSLIEKFRLTFCLVLDEKGEWKIDTVIDQISMNSETKYNVVPQKIYENTNDYTIKILYPQIRNFPEKMIEGKFNKRIQDYVNYLSLEFKKEVEAVSGVKSPSWTLSLSSQTKFKNRNVVCVVLTSNRYTGGAHLQWEYFTIVFDLRNGKEIKLSNLFRPSSNYLKTLSQYCINYLLKEAKKNSPDGYYSEVGLIKEGASAKEENYKNFYLNSNGIIIIFLPYQVAGYAAGTKEVFIPYKKFKNIIDPNGPINLIL
ncbi:MAG: DUF3298 and DUF4163 domain-containing protein [Firmicutes bacterium]|nr:DUF3298 and DUF4163 domain-containing protein [Bacillota bacterium]